MFRLVFIISLLSVIFWPMFGWMTQRWMAPDSYYSHGFLIPLVSGFFIWKKKDLLKEVYPGSNRALGIGLLLFALFVQLISTVLRVYFLQAFALLILIYGFLFYYYRLPVAKQFFFPLAFLIFMIPLPLDIIAGLNLNLKMYAAEKAVAIVKALGIHCVREGSRIHFLNCTLTVGNVCSGLRSLISLLALGALFAYISKVTWLKKCMIFAASFPVAIIANITRIVLLCVIANKWGAGAATGFFHDFSGMMLFVIAYLLLFLLEALLGFFDKKTIR